MIFLDVKQYCHKCAHFEADVEKETKEHIIKRITYVETVNKPTGNTIVRCKHRELCERIRIEFSHPNEEDLK